jgi:gas vesicle protein
MFEGTPLEVGVLIGFAGIRSMTRGQMAKREFSVGLDHMMQAAQHAAGGMGSAMGPHMHSMRSMMLPAAGRVRGAASYGWGSTVSGLAPLMLAARTGAREATEAAIKAKVTGVKRRKAKQKRMGMALGLLAAGVAFGAVTALVVRRRRRNAWEEYDPSDALESMMGKADHMKEKAAGMKTKSSDMASDVRSKGSEMGQMTGDAIQKAAGMSGDAIQKAGDKTSDSMQKAADRASDKAQKASDRYADTSDRMR